MMEVCAEAKRVMVQAVSKMYSSRSQRGGIPLHRSLLLTLVMRAARDAYHSARVPNSDPDTSGQGDQSEERDSLVTAAHHTHSHTHSHTQELMDTAEAPEPQCALQSGDGTAPQDRAADKENCHQSRKRRGKRGAEPDFLPCKRARLEPAELRRVLHDSNSGQCARQTEPLSATHIPRTMVTC